MSNANRKWNGSIIFTLLGAGAEVLVKHFAKENEKEEVILDVLRHSRDILNKVDKSNGMPIIGMRYNRDIILFKEDSDDENIIRTMQNFSRFKHSNFPLRRIAVYIPGEEDSTDIIMGDLVDIKEKCCVSSEFDGFFVDLGDSYREIRKDTNLSEVSSYLEEATKKRPSCLCSEKPIYHSKTLVWEP